MYLLPLFLYKTYPLMRETFDHFNFIEVEVGDVIEEIFGFALVDNG